MRSYFYKGLSLGYNIRNNFVFLGRRKQFKDILLMFYFKYFF